MKTGSQRSQGMEFNGRAASYNSRPVAAIQSRYRTSPPKQTIQPQPQTINTDVITSKQHHVVQAPIAANPETTKPLIVSTQDIRPHTQHSTKQTYRNPTPVIPVQRAKPVTAPIGRAKPVFTRQHQTIADIPTLPIGKTSKFKRMVWSVKKASAKKKRGYVLTVLAVLLFAIGIGVNTHSLFINKKIESRAEAQASTTDGSNEDDKPSANSGLSEAQPDPKAVAKYTVSPDVPKLLKIDSINVWSRIRRVGVDANSEIGTPKNVYDTAWYDGSAKPGQPGAVFIDGHVSGPTRGGVFVNLKNIKIGSKITIVMGDDSQIAYKVVATEKFDANNVDMTKAMRPYDPTKQGLNIMTCSGKYLSKQETFDKRLVVYAVRDN